MTQVNCPLVCFPGKAKQNKTKQNSSFAIRYLALSTHYNDQRVKLFF